MGVLVSSGRCRVINVDKNPSYPPVVEALKAEGTLRRRCRLRPVQYLNNILEQDHRAIKRRVKASQGFVRFGGLPHDPRLRSGACDSEGASQMGGRRSNCPPTSVHRRAVPDFNLMRQPESMPLLCRQLKKVGSRGNSLVHLHATSSAVSNSRRSSTPAPARIIRSVGDKNSIGTQVFSLQVNRVFRRVGPRERPFHRIQRKPLDHVELIAVAYRSVQETRREAYGIHNQGVRIPYEGSSLFC